MSARTRFARVLLAIVVVVAVAVAVAAAAARPTARHAIKHHGKPSLSWQDCGDGYQCSSLKVPRDYKKPNGPTFDLAIIRLPAQDQAHRIGSLFVNFGGPGGTAVDAIHAFGGDLFGAVNDRFDIVGFDPRGVGESQPSDRLQGQPGDRRHLLAAVHDAVQPRRQGSRREGQGVHQPLQEPERERAPLHHDREHRPATWIASARPWASRSSTTSASPTARSSARPTRASSRTTTARWCSTGPST